MSPSAVDAHTISFRNSVLESFEGACGRHIKRASGPQIASVWMFVDHVLLTYQESVYVTIGIPDRGQHRPVFSNLSSQDRDYLGLRPLEEERFSDEPDSDCIGDDDGPIKIAIRYLPRVWPTGTRKKPVGLGRDLSHEIIKQLYEHPHFSSFLFEALNNHAKSLMLYRGEKRNTAIASPELLLDAREIDAYYDRLMGNRLAPLFDNIATSILTQSPNGQELNFFVVYRRPSSQRIVEPGPGLAYDRNRVTAKYPFSASLLLTEQQQNHLRKIDENLAQKVMWPLEQGERSIADTPLIGGTVDFSLPDETEWGNPWSRSVHPANALSSSAHSRRQAEQELHKMAFAGGPMPKRSSIFYVPIHVNAQPWFAAFRWFDSDLPANRQLNIHFYRDIVSGIADAVGRATEESYADAIARIIAESFEPGGRDASFAGKVSRRLNALGDIYPYQTVKLIELTSSSADPKIGNDSLRLEVSGIDRRLFLEFSKPPTDVYRPLDQNLVREKVEHALQRSVDGEAAEYKKLLEVFGHTIGGIVQASGMGEVTAAANLITRRFGEHPDIHRFSRSVRYLDRRVKLVQGFSETLRTRKNRGRGFPAAWFDGSPITVDLSIVADAAERAALFYLWPRWVLEPRWKKISVITNGHETVYLVDDTYITERAENLPDLPPFRGPGIGADNRHSGTIVVGLGLAELIFNASNNVVEAIRNGYLRNADFPLLRLQIEKVIGAVGEESVKVWVFNCSGRAPNLQSPKAVIEIQQLERAYMHCAGLPVVETKAPCVNEELTAQSKSNHWVQAEWQYFSQRVRRENDAEG